MSTTETLNHPPPTSAPVRQSAGRTGAVIGGSILATVGSVLALGGGGVLAVGGSDGTISSGHDDVSTPTSALVSEVATINGTHEFTDALGHPRVRVNADAVRSDQPVFVGVGRKADVDRYLAGAEIDRVTDFDVDPITLDTSRISGTAHPKPPASQSFWVAKASGSTANLDWKVRDGNYRLVIMNADGSRGVATQSQFEVEIPHLSTIAIVALILGLVTIGGGFALIAPSLRSSGAGSPKPQAPTQQYAIG
jgi:hypothetical protein